jgi:hypothetical protein
MKRKLLTLPLICSVLFMVGFASIPHEVDTVNFLLHVEGKGYPPIESENTAQTRLMARRAAVLDAYRNILVLLGKEKESTPDDAELAMTYGYIRGAQVVDEMLLSDGGVTVKVAYPLSDQEMGRLERKGIAKDKASARYTMKPTLLSVPAVVDLETWIEKLKEERKKAQRGIVPAKPARPIREVKGIHPVSLEEWVAIIKDLRKK